MISLKNLFISALLLAFANVVHSQVTFQAESTSGCAPFGVVINVTNPTSGITSYSWTITTPSGTTLTASSPQYVSIFTTPGNYDVSLTINGSQTQTINDYIQVYSKPTASFVVDDASGCYPHCVNFTSTSAQGTGSIVSWNWDFGDGNTSNQQTPEHCFNAAGTYSPILSVADEHGCFANVTMPSMVQVTNNFPTATFTPSSTVTCNAPVAVALTNTSTGTLALNSSWDFGDGSNGNTAGTAAINHTFALPGTYQVCLTVEDTEGCANETCTTVTVLDDPNPQFTVSDNDVCAGQSVQFSSTTTPVPMQYAWDFDNNGTTDATSATSSFSYPSEGTYHPKLTVTYSPSCSAVLENSITITVNPGINASFNAAVTSSCLAPLNSTLISSVSGSGPFTYNWLINGGSVGSSANLTYSFPSAGTYDVALMISNANGCNATVLQNDYITISSPTVSFSHPATACFDEAVTPTSLAISGNSTITNYSWDFDGDGIEDSDEASPEYVYNMQGAYTISLDVITADGCSASFTSPTPIVVQAPLSTTFTSNYTTTCSANAIEFCIPAVNGNTYSWNFNDGSGWVIMAPNETCIEHMYEDTGYYDLSIMVINGACNIGDTLENYIYIEPPVALFDYAVDCNDNLTVTLLDQSIGANTVTWDFGDGSPTQEGPSILTHTYPSIGTYEVTLVAHGDDAACDDTKIHTLNLAAPDASVGFSTTGGCAPLNVTLFENTSNPHWDVDISNGDYLHADWNSELSQWEVEYYNQGNLYSYNSPANTNFWPQFVFTQMGCYDFTVHVINEFNCEDTQYYEDAVCVSAGSDFASFDINVIDDCQQVLIEFVPQATDITTSIWNFGDGSTSVLLNPTHEYLPPYDYNTPISVTFAAENAQGCSSVVTQTLDLNLPAAPSFIQTDDDGCVGDSFTFLNTTTGPAASYSWDFGDPASGANNISSDINGSHTYSANGIYEVCLSVTDINGCTRTYCEPNAVTIANPEVDFSYTSSINNCLFGVQFTNQTPGTNNNFEWNFGDDQTGTGANTYHTYPLGVYDVTLTLTGNNGCVDSLVIPDILNYGSQIGPYSVELDDAPCAPFTVGLSAFNVTDTYFTYFWDFNDGYGDPTGATQVTHDYQAAGTYCPQLIMTDPNGCQVFIACEEPIVVEEFVMHYDIPEQICFGDTILVTVTNADSYSWSGSIEWTAGAGVGEYILHPTTTTDYLLTGTFADCERTDVIHVQVNALPILTLDVDHDVCHQDSVFVLDSGLPNGATSMYFIDGVSASEFNPSWTPEQAYLVTYQYTDSLGCMNETSESIFIHALPIVTLDPFAGICEDAGVVALEGGLPTGGEYTFDGALATTVDGATGAGNYPVVYAYSDINGCVSSAEQVYPIHDMPEISVSFDETCLNVPFEIENTSTVSDGAIQVSSWWFSNAMNQMTYTPAPFLFDTYGTQEVDLMTRSEFGCTSLLDTSVVIYPIPQSLFTLEDGCQGTDLTFTSQSSIVEGEIVNYIWQFEENILADDDTTEYAYGQWGTLPASLIVESDLGCTDTLSQYVSVYPSPQIQIVTNDICLGDVAHFEPIIDLPYGGIEEYTWSLGIDWIEPHTPVAEHLYDSTGTYTITLDALSNLGCTGHGEVVLHVNPNATVDLAVDEAVHCAGDDMYLFDFSSIDSPYSITGWNWYFDETLVSQEQNPHLNYLDAGTYDLRLEVTTNTGCTSDSLTQHYFVVNPRPVAGFNLNRDELDMSASTVIVENTASEDVTQWYYHFGDGTMEQFASGEHQYNTWDEYNIIQIVSNTFGCIDTAMQQVTVSPLLIINIPNAFTPDGNGHNDCFHPVIFGSKVLDYEFSIYDRWGKLVYITHSTDECWDGSINGGELGQNGVYNWMLKIRSEDEPLMRVMDGFVMMIR